MADGAWAHRQEELAWLHDQVDRLQHEKLDIETQAAEQAETCAQLTEANATLSARALSTKPTEADHDCVQVENNGRTTLGFVRPVVVTLTLTGLTATSYNNSDAHTRDVCPDV